MLAFLQIAFETFEPAFDDAEVGEDDFVLHRPHVTAGIDRAGRVRHRGIAEHPDDVQERVGVAERRDVEQRLRARPARDGPAMSANSTVAGTRLRGLNSAVSRSSRSSGTRETPTFASPLPPGRGASLALVRSWKRAVRPDEGKPMSPARSMRLEMLDCHLPAESGPEKV